jgi:hypothetical protein
VEEAVKGGRFVIVSATCENDIAAARMLFREYAAELSIDLCFQNFGAELATLPGNYAPPMGCFCWQKQVNGTSDALPSRNWNRISRN